MNTKTITQERLAYLRLFARSYPNIREARSALVKKAASLDLPKKTEYFLTDIHGENEAFDHVLKNASGQLKVRIQELFGDRLDEGEIRKMATLLYYPIRKLSLMETEGQLSAVYYKYLPMMVSLARNLANKYTNQSIMEKTDPAFSEILGELLFSEDYDEDKNYYIKSLYQEMIASGMIGDFIVALSDLIQALAVDHLHIIGDIYDRGPAPQKVMDRLMEFHSLDIQFGNHDILWMGAAAGSRACIANVVRISARYANLDILEDAYGINLLPLARLAQEVYGDDPCTLFMPKSEDGRIREKDALLLARMHKAMAIIQCKLEGPLVEKNPEYGMHGRRLLHKINFQTGEIELQGMVHTLRDAAFPTVDPENPYQLTEDEEEVLDKLVRAFVTSESLQRHIRFLFEKGSMYTICNGNLLYHACVPMEEDGSFASLSIEGRPYAGRALLDFFDQAARAYYFNGGESRFGTDVMWYLWQGPLSPLFGKDQMTTFERYFIADKETHKENKNPYFTLSLERQVCERILGEFGLDSPESKIICGHVPVKAIKGEQPVKAEGRLFVIDGGFAKAYQKETGMAGYTLVYNSYGLQLIAHQPFESVEKALLNEEDIISVTRVVEEAPRKYIRDTDEGRLIGEEIRDLEDLIAAYQSGLLSETAVQRPVKGI